MLGIFSESLLQSWTKHDLTELWQRSFSDPEAEFADTPGGMTHPPLHHRELPATESPHPSLP